MNILILHGWGLSGDTYEDLASELKRKGHSVNTPDLPGFGKAATPKKPYKLKDYVNFLLKYLRSKNLSRVTIIGHSFGGRIGIKLAAESPQMVDKLILTGVPGFLAVPKVKIYFFLILAKIGKFIFSFPFLSKFSNLAEKLLCKLAQASDYYKNQGVMREIFKRIVREDLLSSIRRIKCPTLLIWGEEDRVTPLWMAERMRREIKSAKLVVVPGASHRLPYENPKVFLEEIK